MSRYIATRAIRGANALVHEAGVMLQRALQEKKPGTPVSFPNTAYYLPLIYGMTGQKVETLADLQPALAHAHELLHPLPSAQNWTPYLGETLDSGMATLIAAEVIEAIRFVYGAQPELMPGFHLSGGTAFTSPDNGKFKNGDGHLNGPIDDIQLRSWGIQLVDGRMPGFAAIVGCAKSNEVAVKLVRELQRRNILTFLSGNVNGRSIIHQLHEEGVELGYDTYTVPFGTDTLSVIYALGFATRSALTFGGLKAGQARDILLYNKERVFAFVLALGEVDDLKYAAAAGAINFGFPVIADTVIPEILPTGITTYEHVVSMPFNEIPGADDLERAEQLVQKCIEIRGVKIKMTDVPVPVPYGSAFEGEVVRKADMRVEFGGQHSRCFEFLTMADLNALTDGKIEIVGPDFSQIPDKGSMDLGIVVQVAGRQMQKDFEPVLERQIHYFVNGASGVQHIGQRDIAWIRLSQAAVDKGFDLTHFGKLLHARFHADFGAIVDKVQVTLYTDPTVLAEWLEKAREAYSFRNERLADLTDTAVNEFYSCTLCQSFAPDHVCIVSPERLGLCGAYNWLDCKASFSINPTGPNQPIKLGKLLDPDVGYWSGTIDYARKGSHGAVQNVSMYSIMENPMTACGCFECIVMYIPEVEGVMVVSREDVGMTPAGMKFSTLAGMAGGGVQTPGVMGVGKYYLVSPKFISADGGFKRVVWLSKVIKETMADELQHVAEREGIPDLIDRIADGDKITTVEQLTDWVEEVHHPVLDLGPMGREPAELPEPDEELMAQATAVVEAAMADLSAKDAKSAKGEEVVFDAKEAKVAEGAKEEEVSIADMSFRAESAALSDAERGGILPEQPTPGDSSADLGMTVAYQETKEVKLEEIPKSVESVKSVDAPSSQAELLQQAQAAALRQAQALQQAAAEALRQAELLGQARELAAQPATPAEAVESLRQALTAALGALGGAAQTSDFFKKSDVSLPPVVEEVPIIAKAPEPKPEVATSKPEVGSPKPEVRPPTTDHRPPITDDASRITHHASRITDKPWLPATSKTPLAKEKWAGKVREITLGATKVQGGTRAKTVTVGGETAMPFLDFEGVMPHPPVIAVEIRDRKPADWSPLLLEAWGEATADPVRWAQAAEKAGAGLIQLSLGLENGVDTAVATVRSVLQATGLPLIVVGPGQADKDNELLVPIADAFKGERLALGICEDKNYRTIVASAMANDHLVIARTAMDVNLAKQLNILISDMGLPLDRVIMDPTTGALGYGFEYGYSVMERLRLAALQGDGMTQLPMMVTPGEEAWKTKEAKVGVGVPAAWGDWVERAITWETLTATMLIESGADILTLRHPETVRRVGAAIDELTGKRS
ncbi:MAG: CO dehydrogenase/CO-methylating acetyl-CoA synthase complex subunit beta [Anaerolineae bacterium]|nr:CO dehydrogenase/CO-methylating acetyl-CoA synthase complex subunit beta [Anaerolineae bacterium]